MSASAFDPKKLREMLANTWARPWKVQRGHEGYTLGSGGGDPDVAWGMTSRDAAMVAYIVNHADEIASLAEENERLREQVVAYESDR